MENFKLLIFSTIFIFAINANDNLHSYCGSMLIKELKSVCKSHYYGGDKRSSYLDNYIDNTDSDYMNGIFDYNDQVDLLFDSEVPTYSVSNGNYYKRHLKVRNIVNECCKKPCSRRTLSFYCSRAR